MTKVVNGYKIEPYANLEGAVLRGANLEGANLVGAYLKGANLGDANLEGAYLGGAYLKGANLKDADLEGANLYRADLGDANLEGANLVGANLEDAYLGGADLYGADLKGTILETKEEEGKPVINSDGGPSEYYDFQKGWNTWNDINDYKAKNQWLEYSFHLGNIGKVLMRWGDKEGTSLQYDTKKIIYSGCRILMMMVGVEETRAYLQKLLDDPQFKGNTDD